MRRKVIPIAEAVAMIPDGSSLMVGGFMGVGTPARLVDELVRQGRRDLTLICNDTARPGVGVGKLVTAGLVSKLMTSHIGTNPETQRMMLEGKIEVTLIPQGTLAERVRAGGVGLGGVLTPTGVGTLVAEGKPTIELDGRAYLLETAIKADFSLIRSTRADHYGNLEYSMTSRNFNPLMAMASKVTIVEAEDIVAVGVIPPDAVVTPGVLVHYIVARERIQ
jgi:acetate CoA/acetoacetate CoA-transferase alpha subunit